MRSIQTTVLLTNGSSGPDPFSHRSVSHAFDNRLTQLINFLRVARRKGSSNRRSVVHPAFQLELSQNLVAVLLAASLRDLVPPHIRLVQIVNEIDGELDEEVALLLGVVRVVEPVVKVSVGSEPEHRVRAVLDPV